MKFIKDNAILIFIISICTTFYLATQKNSGNDRQLLGTEVTAKDMEKVQGKRKNQDLQGFVESNDPLLHVNENTDPIFKEMAKPQKPTYSNRGF